ncbi:FAD-binding protein [Herbaspirillum lusitanum]|uniref:FAD-dependent oxidoreductase n=1 Tax=Herbaspirillum lusitanum TaxID=213312 RepID=UPI000316345B|nr:FAD-binding protein [Herbaspirillum lusitanum]
MSQQEKTVDVLIVGCGVAGLSAAVTALEGGLSVLNLERATPDDFGGGSRWTEAYMRMKNDSEVSDDFEEHFANNAGPNLDLNVLQAVSSGGYEHWPSYVKAHPFPDPELIAKFADSVPGTISWLKGFGLKFEPQPIYLLTQNTTRIAAQGGGLKLIETLREKALGLGGEIAYRTTAVDLLRDDSGRVIGVRAVGPDGIHKTILARNVVLASGGYQGNQEMMTHYIGPKAKNIRPVATGGYYSRGEGIRMALAAGAAPAGEYGSYHAEPVDPRSSMAEAVVFIYPYGILVNTEGKRFIDEAPGTVDAHYDNISRSFADQPKGLVYVVFDSKVEDIPRWKTSIRSDIPPLQANSLADLAKQMNVSAEALQATVASFNAACPPPPKEFTPFQIDHCGTKEISPPKSHWSRSIDKGPFYAYPIISSNCFTFGGLKVNTDAQVLTQDGHVIPGLYAAGETVGIYHQVYTGSTSVLRGLTFGRIAASHMVRTK